MAEYIWRDAISAPDYNLLREAVGWGALPEDQAIAGLTHSFRIAACYAPDGTIAGMARLLWDGGYIAYVSDVIVLPEHRRKGIATRAVNALLEHLRAAKKEDWRVKVVLTAASDRESFYERFGFVARPNTREGAGMTMWII